MIEDKSFGLWNDYVLFGKSQKVFCDKRNCNKWALAEVERHLYDKEYIEPSLL